MIYLDNAATTCPFPEVKEAMLPFLSDSYGNPSAAYELGEDSKQAVEQARKMVAATLYTEPDNIYFTSGGTESDNWALRFAVERFQLSGKNTEAERDDKQIDKSEEAHIYDFTMHTQHRKVKETMNVCVPHIITSAIEHHAILHTCGALKKEGVRVTYIPVGQNGIVDLSALERAICPETVLISVMAANNEIGTIQPIERIAGIAHRHNILFHTDAVQAYGQIPIVPEQMGIDLMSASGHKFNGPKGIGFLYARKGLDLKPMIFGGAQERNMRAGTENVPGIAGLGKASWISHQILYSKMRREQNLKNYFIRRVFSEIDGVKLNGSFQMRLPNNINLSIDGVNGGALVALMDMEGICISAASACSTGSDQPSHVQLAIGNSEEQAYSAIRITLGVQTTKEEMDIAADTLKRLVEKLRTA